MSTIRLSNRVEAIKPSPTLAVSNRARELRAAGKDVIGLGAGEPDFDTPDHIKQAANQAIADGMTKYTAVDGTPELKQAIIDAFKRNNQLDYDANQILVSAGAKHSLYNLFQAIIDSGNEVIIPAPYWVSYPDMVILADGKPIIVEAGMDQDFKIMPDQLSTALNDRTRLLILNSPSNPTGRVYSREQLVALGETLKNYPNVVVVTDDIYEHILWTEQPFVNIAMACPDLIDRIVVVNGVSKAYSMTGWRIGYAAGPAALIGAMKKIQSQSTSNPTSIAQAAATAALNGDLECVRIMVTEFKKRHDHVYQRLNKIKGVTAITSEGTFYSFPDFSAVIAKMEDIEDDVTLAAHILDAVGVALVPGSAFGAPGHLRLSYATDMATLDSAIDRLEKLLGTE